MDAYHNTLNKTYLTKKRKKSKQKKNDSRH